MPRQPLLYLPAAQASSFFIYPFHLLPYYSLISAHVTYRMLCPPNPCLEKQRISLGMTSVLRMYFCLHVQITCKLVLKYAKTKKVFTCGEKLCKKAWKASVNNCGCLKSSSHLIQHATQASIEIAQSKNAFSKIAPLKNIFKTGPVKMHL